MKSICLAMIVKNEAHVIERCLRSALPHIAHFVICDTGSADGTLDVARGVLVDVPGEYYHDDWRDFGHNRSLAMRRALGAGCDYVLMLDADETIALEEPYALRNLEAPSYAIRTYESSYSFVQERLFRADIDWSYIYPIHECPECLDHADPLLLHNVRFDTRHDGARGLDPGKYERDIAWIREALGADPHNVQLLYHLAMSEFKLGKHKEAEEACEQVLAEAGASNSQIWYTGYMLAHIYASTGRWWLVPDHFLHAYAELPMAAEPLYWLGRFHMDRAEYTQALPYLEIAGQKARPDLLFLAEERVYAFEARVWLAKCLVALERPGDANMVLLDLIEQGRLPSGVLEENTEASLRALATAGA